VPIGVYARPVFDKKRILKHGEPAEATVLSVDQRSHLTSNELRDYDYVLEVRPERGPSFEANVRAKFWMVGLRPKSGDVLKVRIAQKSREVVFDLEGDPRYDVDAMNAQTEKLRASMREQPSAGQFPGQFGGPLGDPPASSPAPSPPEAKDDLDRLEQLVRLRDAGALSPEEFEEQKARILG
jgi:hypothetical protein